MRYHTLCHCVNAGKFYRCRYVEPIRVFNGMHTHPVAIGFNHRLGIQEIVPIRNLSENRAHADKTLCGVALHCGHLNKLDLEYRESTMIHISPFHYPPGEHEAERASHSYLMSLVAVIAGLPLPIINVIATGIFFFGNRKSTYFVRWHCTQAFLSQLSMLFINSYGFWWTIAILLGSDTLSSHYVGYIITAIIFNLLEFVATLYTAIQTRKGHHVVWWLYGDITNLICKTE